MIQPAPETEEEMMVEIFKYTERVVNMVRPRKLLLMAIGAFIRLFLRASLTSMKDGVAPRAKMNQQRSRRFRSSQEAKEKDEARKESLILWERASFTIFLDVLPNAVFSEMGQTVTDEMRNKTSWDSNAITPGTPFMELLAASLRYWVVQKLNTDPGWKGVSDFWSAG